jgi:hypothetical protein
VSRQGLAEVLGRAAIDPDFLGTLRADPESALDRAGVHLSDDDLAAVKKLDFDGLAEFNHSLQNQGLDVVGDKPAW